jgi:hypothetical protein
MPTPTNDRGFRSCDLIVAIPLAMTDFDALVAESLRLAAPVRTSARASSAAPVRRSLRQIETLSARLGGGAGAAPMAEDSAFVRWGRCIVLFSCYGGRSRFVFVCLDFFAAFFLVFGFFFFFCFSERVR